MRTRDYRRYQLAKVKKRIRERVRNQWGDAELADDARFVGRWATARAKCSCYCCGNRRKHEGATRLERVPIPDWE